jgi:hypothetical protein
VGERETHALPAGRRRRRRNPDVGLPASRGKGTRIFEDSKDRKLVDATGFENGVVLLRYEIKK